jgi:glycerol-3-phosphate dehydrogenase
MVERLTAPDRPWDILIIGGGATGLGIAVDAATRWYRVALVEQHDFAKATSSRSTKLIHGGVRYLQQGNIGLVRDALLERGRLVRNAPHLVHRLGIVLPTYQWWEAPYYGTGLKLYDLLSGRHGLGPSHRLSREAVLDCLPTLRADNLRGGVLYYDGQFDDSRLIVNMAQTAAENGAALANYLRVTELIHEDGKTRGAVAVDEETGTQLEIRANVVINATGVFTDSIRQLDETDSSSMVQPSQGTHVVLPKEFLPGNTAFIVPKTDDGRVLFGIPWRDHVVIGTTDTAVDNPNLEPRPFKEEIEYILEYAKRYLNKDVSAGDVLSVFAGLRPLVRAGSGTKTSALSRDHVIRVSGTGLVTIAGGKWTTYRKMAEDAVDRAIAVGQLERQPCRTAELKLHGAEHFDAASAPPDDAIGYGDDANAVRALAEEFPSGLERMHPELPIRPVDVVWALRNEMARSVEDILARRTRCLLLDARASKEIAPQVADIVAAERNLDDTKRDAMLADFEALANDYLP